MDTSTASGRLRRTTFKRFAVFELEVISHRIRTRIGRAKAKAKKWGGRKAGDRYKLSREKLDAMRGLVDAGNNKAAIARQLGISRSTVYRGLDEMMEGRRDG